MPVHHTAFGPEWPASPSSYEKIVTPIVILVAYYHVLHHVMVASCLTGRLFNAGGAEESTRSHSIPFSSYSRSI